MTWIINGSERMEMDIIATTRVDALTGSGVEVDGVKIKAGEVGEGWKDVSESCSYTGWGSTTTKSVRYKKIGDGITLAINVAGTSNATSTSITLPDALTNTLGVTASATFFALNDGDKYTTGVGEIATAAKVINFQTVPGTSWTWGQLNAKAVRGEISYKVAV